MQGQVLTEQPKVPGIDPSFEEIIEQRWEKVYFMAKKRIQGSQAEKEEIMRKRILKFFQDYHVQTENFYVERRNIPMDNFDSRLIFPNALLVYGVDFLSFERIKNYFVPYQVQISIYDDSHCSIEFSDPKILVQCFFERMKDKFESPQVLFDFFNDNPTNMVTWFEIQGYKEMMFERKLFARFLYKQDDTDTRNGSFGRKMLSFLQKAKHKFVRHMENLSDPKNIRPKRRYGGNSCRECERKVEKLREIVDCQHKPSDQRNEIKEEEEEDYDNLPQESRRSHFNRGNNNKKRYFKGKFQSMMNKEPVLRPIIQQITNYENMSITAVIPNIISPIKQKEGDDYDTMRNIFSKSKFFEDDVSEKRPDELYRSMLTEISKYDMDEKEKNPEKEEIDDLSYLSRDESDI